MNLLYELEPTGTGLAVALEGSLVYFRLPLPDYYGASGRVF